MTNPIDVLVLEDRPADAELMVHELEKAGYDVAATRVETMDDLLAALHGEPDLILADYTLPGFTAEAVLEALRARKSGVPVIIVSGTIQEEKAVECMRLGAVDYILKDRLARLGPAARAALDAKAERVRRRVAEEELARSKRHVLADAVYTRDRIGSLARIFGAALATGESIADVQEWPGRIQEITATEVQAVARKYLTPERSVTGYLVGAPGGRT